MKEDVKESVKGCKGVCEGGCKGMYERESKGGREGGCEGGGMKGGSTECMDEGEHAGLWRETAARVLVIGFTSSCILTYVRWTISIVRLCYPATCQS